MGQKLSKHTRRRGDSLPDDILVAIFQRLPWRDRIRVECVCRRWRRLSYSHGWAHLKQFSYKSYISDSEYDISLSELSRHNKIGSLLDRCGQFVDTVRLRVPNCGSTSSAQVVRLLEKCPNARRIVIDNAEADAALVNHLIWREPSIRLVLERLS